MDDIEPMLATIADEVTVEQFRAWYNGDPSFEWDDHQNALNAWAGGIWEHYGLADNSEDAPAHVYDDNAGMWRD